MEFRLTVTTMFPCDASVPPPGETLSHDGMPISDQFSEVPPELVREKFWLVTVNGPPTGPLDVKPVSGKIPSVSGGPARALIKL